uniref:Ubiquitin-like protease family profile domain-containing protein n=1 Tax=Hordeum vulgare subsp. vulgare TaxID=112509 RepID=A0A8I6XPW0_HORVV
MDHIDIRRGYIVDYSIDYSLPRACFVKELDFTAVIAVDTVEDGFGKRPFSSTTPYATTKFLSYIEQVAQLPHIASASATETPVNRDADGAEQPTEGDTNEADGRVRNVHEPPPKNMEGGDDVCGSLEDWQHPLPTFEDSELPPHMRAIFNKHKDIHAAELKGALSSFGSLLEGIYRKRMGLMLSEGSKAGFRSDKAKHECPDVTFDVPAAPAPATCNATASDSSPQQQKQLDSTTGTTNATVNISSPQQPKQHEIRDVPQVESPPRSPAVDIESFMEIRERIPKFDNLFAAATSPVPVYDVTPPARIPPISTGPAEACIDDITEEAQVEVSSGRGHDQKHPTLKRAAPTEPTAAKLPKMKKKKIDAMDDAIYQSVDPSSFNPNACTKDFKRACEKNDIAKSDQLFFNIVKQDHWALVVVNLMHKQFNIFDSNSEDSDYVSILEKPCCNLIENFKTLVRERNPWKHDLDMFERFNPSGYPQQSTT